MFGIQRYCYSESLCRPNASHQIVAHSGLPFISRCCSTVFKMAPGRRCGHIKYLKIIWNLCVAPMLPLSFGSIQLTVCEEMSFEKFPDGHRFGHLGYRNEIILAILNLHVSTMLPTKFRLNPTYRAGADVV